MAAVQTSTDDVFINCPFDDAFAPTFLALIFGILMCGFRPLSARELDDGGQTRIDKILGLIEQCRYGIHDLSRTELDAVNNLPRFNMPRICRAKRSSIPRPRRTAAPHAAVPCRRWVRT